MPGCRNSKACDPTKIIYHCFKNRTTTIRLRLKSSILAAALKDKHWAFKDGKVSTGFRCIREPLTLVKCLSPRDPFSWLPVACFLPPLAPASMLFHGASVDNSVHLWLHLKTCGYFLLKEAKRVMVFNWLLVFTCTSVSGWLFRLILHRQSNSFETSDLNVKAMCYSKKSVPEKLWNSPRSMLIYKN